MNCCLRMICKICVKRKAKELLTMPLKMKQQLMQIQAQRLNGQVPKELLYMCPHCQAMHPIKEMLRWPVNQVVESYVKEVILSSSNARESEMDQNSQFRFQQHLQSEEQLISTELGQGEEDPFSKAVCDRCEKAKPKLVCYDCGSLGGSALCEKCSQLIH
mmetsp:Transcript_21252/g.20402  ORF Transcript_21252/g.20402 Transcript_21252/m.20402 type:complete len:160 (+) Transcript_21252:163-642(+)